MGSSKLEERRASRASNPVHWKWEIGGRSHCLGNQSYYSVKTSSSLSSVQATFSPLIPTAQRYEGRRGRLKCVHRLQNPYGILDERIFLPDARVSCVLLAPRIIHSLPMASIIAMSIPRTVHIQTSTGALEALSVHLLERSAWDSRSYHSMPHGLWLKFRVYVLSRIKFMAVKIFSVALTQIGKAVTFLMRESWSVGSYCWRLLW
jgi:hypothetical protein